MIKTNGGSTGAVPTSSDPIPIRLLGSEPKNQAVNAPRRVITHHARKEISAKRRRSTRHSNQPTTVPSRMPVAVIRNTNPRTAKRVCGSSREAKIPYPRPRRWLLSLAAQPRRSRKPMEPKCPSLGIQPCPSLLDPLRFFPVKAITT
jgi:hypothetical protein